MNMVLIALKVLFYSIIGYYIESFINEKGNPFYGPISLFYGLFGILAGVLNKISVIYLFVLGVCWGVLVNTFLGIIDSRVETALKPKYFGLLNIVNVLFVEDFFDWFILESNVQSITFLFIFGISLLIIDVALTFRKLL